MWHATMSSVNLIDLITLINRICSILTSTCIMNMWVFPFSIYETTKMVQLVNAIFKTHIYRLSFSQVLSEYSSCLEKCKEHSIILLRQGQFYWIIIYHYGWCYLTANIYWFAFWIKTIFNALIDHIFMYDDLHQSYFFRQ